MQQDSTFDDYVAERNLQAARLVSVLTAILVPSGVVLDWFTHRDHVGRLFLLRVAAAAVAGACFWLTHLNNARRRSFELGLAPILATAIAIELMIEGLEGYSSPYYAGLTHCLFALGVIFYWRVPQIVVACSLVLAAWMIPTLTQLERVEIGPFANNFFALGVAAAIAVASNGSRFAAVKREYSARSDLVDALDRLKELDHAKSRFFANVSHELRTPLTLILAPLSELLERGGMDAEGRNLVHVAQRNASRLLLHIDELLDLSRLDAGRLRLNLGEIDLLATLNAQVENSRASATASGLELVLDAPQSVNGVWGDAHRIDIVLTNLLGNALKFTPSGGKIVLRLRDDGDAAIVQVSDTGFGIPENDLPRVFERFYQVASSDRRRRQGAGLGLALAKELVELHGGTLTAESELDKGSTFTVRLVKGKAHFRPDVIERRASFRPGARQDRRFEDVVLSTPQVESSAPALDTPGVDQVSFNDRRRARILLVEDHAELRALIRRLLEPLFDVSEAFDGQAALESIRKTVPDLVVSDIMMPNMSGTELCRTLKSDPVLRVIPVILLTARVGSEATMDAYAHGADDFVSKPFHPRVLLARVTAQLRLRALTLQLVTQEKTAVIGTLAAGVAHEVRNPLSAISGACHALLPGTETTERRERLLNVAIDAVSRVDAIVTALDAHARPAEADGLRPCSLREGIDATLRLLEARLTPMQIHRDYENVKDALVRPVSINQVVLNLVDNAIKADAKNLWISVKQQQDRIFVSIEDDGQGVSPDNAAKIFDPFFTTRAPGSGTGLGLYLSSQILLEHGGRLRHESRAGGGARFAFDVPVATA